MGVPVQQQLQLDGLGQKGEDTLVGRRQRMRHGIDGGRTPFGKYVVDLCNEVVELRDELDQALRQHDDAIAAVSIAFGVNEQDRVKQPRLDADATRSLDMNGHVGKPEECLYHTLLTYFPTRCIRGLPAA